MGVVFKEYGKIFLVIAVHLALLFVFVFVVLYLLGRSLVGCHKETLTPIFAASFAEFKCCENLHVHLRGRSAFSFL
jgi:hypothetical protein